MASDGYITENDHICLTDYAKVRRLVDGRIVGFAGNSYNWQPFGDWLDNDCNGDPPAIDASFRCIVLHKDGSVVTYDQLGRSFREGVPCAIGSGTRFALAWMDAGHDAAEAVAYACRRDIYSGGHITVLHLEEK